MRAISPRNASIWFCRSSRLRRSDAFSSLARRSSSAIAARCCSTRWRRSRMARRASSSSNSAACAPAVKQGGAGQCGRQGEAFHRAAHR
jgi:hypothetical protein